MEDESKETKENLNNKNNKIIQESNMKLAEFIKSNPEAYAELMQESMLNSMENCMKK